MTGVLVTGATGFIGQSLCRRLLEAGYAVTAASRGTLATSCPGTRPLRLDVTDPSSLEQAAAPYETVYHLAGDVDFTPRGRERLFAVNAGGTAALLGAARSWGAGRVVVASSACTVGLSRDPGTVLDETAPADPALLARNPYMDSKAAAEKVCFEAAAAGQDVVVVNPTTVYGAGDHSRNSGTLVLSVAGAKVVPVPPGGSNVVGVRDVAEGMLAAAARGRSGQRYILGGGNLSFANIIETVAEAVGRRPLRLPVPMAARPFVSLGLRLAGRLLPGRLVTPQLIEDLFAFKYYSGEKAARELGWRASQPMVDVIGEAWAYYRSQGLA